MISKNALLWMCLSLFLALPVAAQFPLPPDPGSGGGVGCGGNRVCRDSSIQGEKPAPAVPDSEVQFIPSKAVRSGLKAVPAASPMPFFAVGDGKGDNSSNIYRFDYFYGTVGNFVSLGEAGVILWDIAIDLYDGAWSWAYAISNTGRLYRIDTMTGAISLVGSTGQTTINALDFCGGTLYGWGQNVFVSINKNTAAATVIGNPSHSSAGDLMCDNFGSGNLYGIDAYLTNPNGIDIFNMYYGLAAWTGLNLPGSNFYGGEIDGMGQMWAARQTSTGAVQLYWVDRTTNTSTRVGTLTTTYGMNGMATFPAAW
jgi:hypothetical protein